MDITSDGDGRRDDSTLRWISAAELPGLVSASAAMTAVEEAMCALSLQQSIAPQRWTMALDETARMGFMPGALPNIERFGIKVLSLFDPSARGELPSHQGVMLLFDMKTGRPLCALDAASLTAFRTAAASAVATRALARPDSATLAIIGCGDLAAPHLAAMAAIFPLRSVYVWNRTRSRAEAFAREHSERVDCVVCETPSDAARAADIICTLTSAPEPILDAKASRPGQHFNLVGSSTAEPREVADDLVVMSRYFVDSRSHALSQAAELRSAIDGKRVTEHHILGEIGEVLLQRVSGRTHADDVTVYKSLGHVVQDLAVANIAYAALTGGS